MRLLLLILTTLALPAWGADAGSSTGLHLFTPPVGDIAVSFLQKIFGAGKDGMGLGGENTMLGAAMAVFNQAVLLLAMLFTVFTTIKGTVDSAHDGVILGKKMSEIWVPIRTVAGTAFLLPLSSGFSLIQMGVLWLALQGVGIADTLWMAALERFAETGTLVQPSIPAARPLAASILRAEVCMAAMNKQYEAEGRKERIEAKETFPRINFDPAYQQKLDPTGIGLVDSYYETAVQVADSFYTTVNYRWQSTVMSKGSPAVCGSLEWQESEQDARTKSMTHAPRSAIMAAHKKAVKKMIEELRPVAQQIVSGQRPPAGIVDAAANTYEGIIASAAKAAVDASPDIARSSFIKHAETGGFIKVGTWYNHITKMNDTIQASVNGVPTFKPMAIESMEVSEVLQNYRDALVFTDAYLLNRGAAAKDNYQAELENSSSIRSSEDVWKLLSRPAMSAMEHITQQIAGANTSPLTQLAATGNTVLATGFALKSAYFVMAGFAGSKISNWTVGIGFDVGAALNTISGAVEFLSSALWALGLMLAVYLPAIPAIFWIVNVIRFFVGVCVAVLAAPLMAAMMASSSGDDFAGRSGPGWMLLVALVLQPALLVLGFLFAAMMLYPAGELVNMMFLSVVSGASQGSVVGPITMVAWIGVYVAMMVLTVHACFAVINLVPEGVMQFVGSQAGAHGIGQQQADKGISGLETTSEKAGHAAVTTKPPGGGDHKPGGKTGNALKGDNGFTNADHMPGS